MFLTPSIFDITQLLQIYETKMIPGHFGLAEVEAFYVPPKTNVEVWDRVLEFSNELHLHQFLFAQYAGEIPAYQADYRRYRRRFSASGNRSDQVVTFASSFYWMEPLSIIFQGKRVATTGEGIHVCHYRILVCDEDNRGGLPAFLEEQIDQLEEQEAKLPPPTIEIVPPEPDRVLVHA